MYLRGLARVDRRTKNLVKRLQPGELAVIDHEDIDEVAGQALVEARARAVINAARSISGKYPNLGPITLAEAGIPLIDDCGPEVMERIAEGDRVEVVGGNIYVDGRLVARGIPLTRELILEQMEASKANFDAELAKFVDNTLEYARKEQQLILGGVRIPEVRTRFRGRHALIVVRGQNYKEDLQTIKSYISEMKPVLVGVDGGADALLEFGLRPDLIIGDMDSISDAALKSGAELVVHAYCDGRAPGMERVRSLGLTAITFPAPGTSEDIAMLLAYEKGAELIVAVGTHSNIVDFLEKGRKGMASTFLVRLKVGSILIDAKGVNKLYRSRIKLRYLAQIVAAALIPFFIILAVSPVTRPFLELLWMQLKIIFNI